MDLSGFLRHVVVKTYDIWKESTAFVIRVALEASNYPMTLMFVYIHTGLTAPTSKKSHTHTGSKTCPQPNTSDVQTPVSS
jgi:hypothetical protein